MTTNDRQRLRELAHKQLEYAHSPRNEQIMQQWQALADGRRENPTVRLLYSNFTDEVITPRLKCETEEARSLEWQLLCTLVGRELFDDDTPIPSEHMMARTARVRPFGISHTISRTDGGRSKGFHIDPVIEDLEDELDKLRGGHFQVDQADTKRRVDFATEAIGDILPVKLVQSSLTGAITNPLVHLMGMENYYLAMYDTSEALHEVMDMATRVYEAY